MFVSTAVLAESLTGDARRDVRINATLKRVLLLAVDEATARGAAALRHKNRQRGADTIDAIVVATANRIPGTRILTTDAGRLRPLAATGGLCFVFGV